MRSLGRRKNLNTLRNENSKLLQQRLDQEVDVMELKKQAYEIKEKICCAKNVFVHYKERINELQNNVRILITRACENGWNLHFNQDCASEELLNTQIANLCNESSIDMLLKLYGNADILPCDPELDMILKEISLLPNLSHMTDFNMRTMSISDESREKGEKALVNTCAACKVRLLPVTAPVFEKYRDVLVECSSCKLAFHLCCADPPLPSLPQSEYKCKYCTKAKLMSENMVEASRQAVNISSSMDCYETKPRRRVLSTASQASSSRRARNTRCDSSNLLPQTSLSLSEVKSELLKITGPSPSIPPELFRSQNCSSAHQIVLRAFVFGNLETEDYDMLQNIAMWRIMTNIPPRAEPAEVLAMIRDGEHVRFGKVARSFQAYDDASQIISSINDVCEEADDDENESGDFSDDNGARISRRRCGSMNSSSKGSSFLTKPERQSTRWDGDLYKPFWTRGFGKLKEGWCGLCKPGVWLKTKTSVYW